MCHHIHLFYFYFPLAKGARGMFHQNGIMFENLSYGTSPTPLHKGDLKESVPKNKQHTQKRIIFADDGKI